MNPDAVSVILFAHNEEATIQQEIRSFYQTIVQELPDCELIVAEDGSVDGTRQLIDQIRSETGLRIVGAAERLGYAKALLGALVNATKPWIFLCDCGMKHDPADFWKLFEERHCHDLIVGRKTNRRDQRYRRFLTWGLNLFLRLYFGVPVHDADTGMRLMRKAVAEKIAEQPMIFRGFIASEIVIRAISLGFRYKEVPISYRRRVGESRGLPMGNVPRVILRLLADARALRGELRRTSDPAHHNAYGPDRSEHHR